VPEWHPLVRLEALEADARVLEPERLAREVRLDLGRHAEALGGVLDVVAQVALREVGHGADLAGSG
jgi:hypothetical protein